MFRNIPLLLQILFWYVSAIALLPAVADSIQLGPALLNNRGLFLPSLQIDPAIAFNRPHVEGFDVTGGVAILPELMALTLGLSIYNGAFLAEIFRAGILSVPRGQIEAAATVGLSGARAASLVVLPQALRVALPAAGGQYQTLAKASSLAAAIGYPDIMQIVGGTVASQTSQALEAMTLVVLLYAAINLAIALIAESGESPPACARRSLADHALRHALRPPDADRSAQRAGRRRRRARWRRALFPSPAIGALSLALLALFVDRGVALLRNGRSLTRTGSAARAKPVPAMRAPAGRS